MRSINLFIILLLSGCARAKPQELFLYTPYAYEWDHYGGSANAPGQEAALITDVPLTQPFVGRHMLALGVYNANKVPVDARLNVTTPQDVTIVEWSVAKSACWVREMGWTYMCHFVLDSESRMHADAQFDMSFPKAGTYQFLYSIKGVGMEDKSGTFMIRLTP